MKISRINRRGITRFSLEQLESRRVLASISGQVINDLNGDSIADANEPGVAGIHVFDDQNGNGELDRNGTFIEPDDFAEGDILTNANAQATLSLTDETNEPLEPSADQLVIAKTDELASTGNMVFGWGDNPFFRTERRLRMDFEAPVSSVSIDFTGTRVHSTEEGILTVFDQAGTPRTISTPPLAKGESATISIVSDEADIAFAVAYADLAAGGGLMRLDNLRMNAEGSELWTVSGPDGSYGFDDVPGDSYNIGIVVPDGQEQTFPEENTQAVTVGPDDVVSDIDFGIEYSWQNAQLPVDVNNDGDVAPNDILAIVNELNNPEFGETGTGLLPAPPDPVPSFFDVDGDGFVAPKDILEIVNFLNNGPGAALAALADTHSFEGKDASAMKTQMVINVVPANAKLEQIRAAALFAAIEEDHKKSSSLDDETMDALAFSQI